MPTWLIFLLVLSLLVLVHEMGHFLAAKILGIRVEEFAIGLPFTKPFLKIKKGETQYAVYPLLFGGFVRLMGEEGPVNPTSSRNGGTSRGVDYWSRGIGQRWLVVAAGVIMNVILALAAFGVLYSVSGVPVSTRSKVTVVQVVPGAPAETGGIKPDDRIVKVEGKEVVSADQFGTLMKSWAGIKVNLTVERGKTIPLFEGISEGQTEQKVLALIPRRNPPKDQGALGVTIADYPYLQTIKCSVFNVQCSIRIAGQGMKSTGIWIGRVADGLRMIGKSLLAGRAPEGVSGPVGIYQLTGIVAAEGWLPLVELVAVLSVNLAVFNVLPIPALDGGRLLFIWLELLFRKRISSNAEQKVNSWGMAFLLILMIVISLQDVWRLGIIAKLLGK